MNYVAKSAGLGVAVDLTGLSVFRWVAFLTAGVLFWNTIRRARN